MVVFFSRIPPGEGGRAFFARNPVRRVLAFCLLLAGMVLFLAPRQTLGAEENGTAVFWGAPAGEQIASSADFSDIRSHWAEESIVRQAAQGILRGYGNRLFRPENAVSRQEAVAALIRAMGKEQAAAEAAAKKAQAAQAAGSQAAGGAGGGENAAENILAYSDWAAGFLQTAVDEGIISETDLNSLKWTEPARREEVIAWTARAAGLSPVYGADQRAVYGFRDAASVDPSLLPAVEAALQGGLAQGASAEELRPRSLVKRAEVAVLLDRAANRWLTSRGIAVYEGTVIEKGDVTGSSDFSSGRAAGTGSTVFPDTAALRGYTRVLVEGKNPPAAELLFYRGEGSGVPRKGQREAAVYRVAEGRLGLSDLLAAGDEIRYFVRGSEVFYIEVKPSSQTKVQGVITSADAALREITLQGSDGRIYRLPVSAAARITVNGRFASLSDLHGGEEAAAEVRQGEVQAVEVVIEEGEPGYLPAALKKVYGQIVRREGQYLYVAVGQGAEREVKEFRLASFATASRAGEEIPLSEAAPGDWGWLVLEEGGSGRVLSLQLEKAAPRQVTLLRGWAAEIQPLRQQLLLKFPERYGSAGWEAEGSLLSVQMGKPAEIFVDGERITLEQAAAASLKGRRCYLAAYEYYGELQAVRAVFCPAYELTFYETAIGEVSHPRQEFALDSRLFSWDAGTLVLQEGRLVDASVLSAGQQATVVGVRRGSGLRAVAAVLLGGRPLAVQFYRGELYALDLDQFRLEDGFYWKEGDREDISYDGAEIGLNEQTLILDSRRSADPAAAIDYKKFVNYRFKQDSAEQVEDFADCDLYVLADVSAASGTGEDGGLPQALIINIRGQDESREGEERILKGRVLSVNAQSAEVTLKEIQEWNAFYRRWNLAEGTQTISLRRAGIALNRRPVNYTALRPGDELYVLRDASGAILVSARRE